MEATISQLEFSEGDGKLFKECFMVVYAQRKSEATVDSVKYSQTLDEMKLKQDAAYQTLKTTSSDSARARRQDFEHGRHRSSERTKGVKSTASI
ncbi:hypothetical protein KJZ63_04155 [Patescibacteria group bacterium]|nr:hypothetical protein [Patescibacteria group bacterium]